MLRNILAKNRRHRTLKDYPDYAFFRENKVYLTAWDWLKAYTAITTPEELINANIMIYALRNKATLENAYDLIRKMAFEKLGAMDWNHPFVKEKWAAIKQDLPFFVVDGQAIFIPFFDRATNRIYAERPYQLDDYPYSLLKKQFKDVFQDPFELYNYHLFESPFAFFEPISQDGSSRAYYYPLHQTIYVINDQGGFDFSIPLFDRALTKINLEGMNERLSLVMQAYFRFEPGQMVEQLFQQQFISNRLWQQLKLDLEKSHEKKGRSIK